MTAAYEQIGAAVHDVYRIALHCAACVADGGRYRVQLVLRSAGVTLSDAIELRLYPATENTPPEPPIVEAPAQDTDETVEPAAEPEPAESGADTAPAELGEDTTPTETTPETPAAPAAASEPPAQEAKQAAPEPPALWWKRPEVLGGGAGLLLLFLLLLALKRRRSQTAATEPAQAEDGSERQQPTAVAEPIAPSPTEAASTTASAAPPASIGLIALDGSASRDDSPLTIGRDESNRWPLPGDDTVSTEHARILERGDVLVLEDLGSTNGTFLNGVTVKAANPLHDGDLIRIGELELRVVLREDQ